MKRPFFLLSLAVFFVFCVCVFSGSSSFSQERKPLKQKAPYTEIWLPPDFQKTEGPWPLLVFSHGFGGCEWQSTFLTKFLADQGYIVIAPRHADARCTGKMGGLGSKFSSPISSPVQGASSGQTWPEKALRSPAEWSDETEKDRRDDVLLALQSVLDDPQMGPFVDQEKMGLVGHSLGGYTVLGLAGAWPSWKDPRFKAVLALSPYIQPYLQKRTLRFVDIPVFYQGADQDELMTPAIMRSNGAYAQTPSPKYFVELRHADHFAWTDAQTRHQDVINVLAFRFFDHVLKKKETPVLPEQEAGGSQGRSSIFGEKLMTQWYEP